MTLADKCSTKGAVKFVTISGTEVIEIVTEMIDTRPGKHAKNYGKSPFLMGESTIIGHFQ